MYYEQGRSEPFKCVGGGGGVVKNAESFEKFTDYIILFGTYIILEYN